MSANLTDLIFERRKETTAIIDIDVGWVWRLCYNYRNPTVTSTSLLKFFNCVLSCVRTCSILLDFKLSSSKPRHLCLDHVENSTLFAKQIVVECTIDILVDFDGSSSRSVLWNPFRNVIFSARKIPILPSKSISLCALISYRHPTNFLFYYVSRERWWIYEFWIWEFSYKFYEEFEFLVLYSIYVRPPLKKNAPY